MNWQISNGEDSSRFGENAGTGRGTSMNWQEMQVRERCLGRPVAWLATAVAARTSN